MRFLRLILLSLLLQVSCAAANENIIRNADFEKGMLHWRLMPNSPPCFTLEGKDVAYSGDACVKIFADGSNAGIQTDWLFVDLDVERGKRYTLSAFVKNDGVRAGSFGIKLYCYTDDDKFAGMTAFASIDPSTPRGDWRRYELTFGGADEFQIPPTATKLFVRASFWSKDGKSVGTVYLDDLRLCGRDEARSRMPHAKQTEGKIAVWKHAAPPFAQSREPEELAEVLNENGFAVSLVTTERLSSHLGDFDALVLPYEGVFPAPAKMNILRFLRGGGNLLFFGSRIPEPLFPATDGWRTHQNMLIGSAKSVPIAQAEMKNPQRWKIMSGKGDKPTSLTVETEGDVPRLRVRMDVSNYQYIYTETTPPDSSYCVLCFSARGDASTRNLVIELNEDDGSRWKTVVRLTEQWRDYFVHTGEFISYATPDRGGAGDYIKPEKITKVFFGCTAPVSGKGVHEFSLSSLRWAKSAVPPSVNTRCSLAFRDDSVYRFGLGSLAPRDRFFIGFVAGFPALTQQDFPTATSFTYLPRFNRRKRSIIAPEEAKARIVAPNSGDGGAVIQVQCTGLFENSAVGAVLESQSPKKWQVAARTLHRMINQPQIFGLVFQPLQREGKITVMAKISNRSRRPKAVSVSANIRFINEGRPIELSRRISLFDREAAWYELGSVSPDGTALRGWKVAAEVRDESGLSDSVIESVDIIATLRKTCDRFIAIQRRRGDGKYSGIAFQDSRAARTLLAVYDLTGNEEYLRSAIEWGNRIISEQRPDGGYRMGYGVHPEGEECFVADGGEIGLGIARIYSYLPDDAAKKKYLDSLRNYWRFRETFRSPTGGYGVGYCKRDYGVRPIKPLDRIVKIMAPEMNLYTVGCTLGFAAAFAAITNETEYYDALARDARWLMARYKGTGMGAFSEGLIWTHRFTNDAALREEIAEYLRNRIIKGILEKTNPNATQPLTTPKWWLGSYGRAALTLAALSYYFNQIERDERILMEVLRVTERLCSPLSDESLPNILKRRELNKNTLLYLSYGGVALCEVYKPQITMKPFRQD